MTIIGSLIAACIGFALGVALTYSAAKRTYLHLARNELQQQEERQAFLAQITQCLMLWQGIVRGKPFAEVTPADQAMLGTVLNVLDKLLYSAGARQPHR